MKKKKEKPIALLLEWAGKDRKWIIMSVICGLVGGILAIGSYIGIYNIMDVLIMDIASKEIIVKNAILITSTVLLRQIFVGVSGVMSHKGAYGALFTVRCMVTEHLSKVPLGALNERRTGDMKTVINEDIEKLERGLAHNLPEFVTYFVGPFVIFIYLLSVNRFLAMISLVPLLFVVVIMIFMFAAMNKVIDKASIASRDFNSVIIEYINGMRLIKAYNMGNKSFKKFKEAISFENTVWNEMARKTGPLYAAFIVALECGVIILVPVGGKMFMNGSIAASVFLLFAYVGSMYLTEILPLQQLAMELAQVLAGVLKVKAILDIPAFEGGTDFPDECGIELRNVSFAYDKSLDNVLENVSLSIKQGEKIAIVGESGAGKSTIIQLISRSYDVGSGEILIGGKNIKDIDYEKLLDNISIVFQKSFLTSGTVLENIKMGHNASLEQVREAAKKAQIDDYIMSLPDKYDTKLSTIGSRFSGGEKQRIAIARAILKDSPILILDEATSAADPENQAQIDCAIEKLCENKTVIIVAHRLDIVKLCDKVAVVENRRVTSYGTHDEVIKTNEYYSNTWNMYKEARNVKYRIKESI